MAADCIDCQKKGLVIFPVRYTAVLKKPNIALPNASYSGAPALGSPKLQYVKRVLRGGYLYVFNEAKAEWYSYVISEAGYLESIPNPNSVMKAGHNSPSISSKDKLCFVQPMHKERSSFIKIKDPDSLTNIWLAYSEVAWTVATFAEHQKPAVRQAHMRKINAKAASGTHVLPLDQIEKEVVEYHPNAIRHKALSDFKNRAFQLRTLKQAAAAACVATPKTLVEKPKAPAPKLVVALDDPTGLIADIHYSMKVLDASIQNIALQNRVYSTDFKINMIRKSTEDAFERDIDARYEDAESRARLEKSNPYIQAKMGNVSAVVKEGTDRHLESGRLGYANAWKKYGDKYNEQQHLAAIKPVKQGFEKATSEQIDPMGRDSVAWQQHELTKKHLTYNYDRKNVQNGLVYTLTITSMLALGMEFSSCRDYALQQFESKTVKDNFIIQAFMLNQDALEKKILATITSGVPLNGLSWSSLFDAVYQVIKPIQALQDVLVKWTQVSIAFVGKHLLRKAARVGLLPGLVSFAAYNRTPLELVNVTGTRKQVQLEFARLGYTQQFKTEAGLPANMKPKTKGSMERSIKWRLGVLERSLVGQNQITTVEFVAIHRSPFTPVNSTARSVVENRIYLPHQIRDLRFNDWLIMRDAAVRNAEQKLEGALKYSPPLLAGAVMLLLQSVALEKANNDMPKTALGGEKEAIWRRRGVYMTMFASGMGMIEATADRRIKVIGESAASKWLKGTWLGARGLGVAAGSTAGAIMAFFDLKNMHSEWSEGNRGVAGLYAASAALGVILVVIGGLMAFSTATATVSFLAMIGVGAAMLPVIGIFLVLAALIIAVIIELVKDNAVQNWLERCIWGKLPDQRYASLAVDDAEFKKAIGA